MNAVPLAPGTKIAISVNDLPRAVHPSATLADVVAGLGFADKKGIAAAVNGNVVPRRDWTVRGLAEGDKVLIIQATQGG